MYNSQGKIEEFFKENNIVYENQYGFTEGGRIEHCLFILDYIANMTYESKNNKNKSLFYAFIDFKKAYDSINRRKLIEVLIKGTVKVGGNLPLKYCISGVIT